MPASLINLPKTKNTHYACGYDLDVMLSVGPDTRLLDDLAEPRNVGLHRRSEFFRCAAYHFHTGIEKSFPDVRPRQNFYDLLIKAPHDSDRSFGRSEYAER